MKTLATAPPLRETFDRVAALSPYLQPQLGAQAGEGWTTPDALFAENSALLDGMVAAARRKYGTTAANVIASVLFQGYQWRLIASAIAAYLADRRVPDLSLRNVQARVDQAGEVDAIAFTSGRFAALPDDPAASDPDATLVADPAALRDHLRSGLEAHLGWVIGQLERATGCRCAGLWLAAADRCAGTFPWLMQTQDAAATLDQMRAEVDALLRAPGSPLTTRKVGLFEMTYQEQRQIFLHRATCCHWYRTDGGGYCATCPHLPQTERHERLLRYLRERHEQAAE